jgi:dihydrofolate reductase
MNVSLDGFVEGPNKNLDWGIIDEEIHTFFNEKERELSALLYGRRIYELMASYWPTADQNPSASAVEVEYAQIWKDKPKIVFSKTLDKVEWNSRLVRDNLAEEVKKLKAQPGNDMGVAGPTLAASFMKLGLIDEFHLMVNPIILGSGTPFFPALDQKINLQLIETRTFAAGPIFLRYQRVNEEK